MASKVEERLRETSFYLKWHADGARYTVSEPCIDSQDVVPLAEALEVLAAVREELAPDAKDAQRWRTMRDVVLAGEKRGDLPYDLCAWFCRGDIDIKYPSAADLDFAVDCIGGHRAD